MTPREPDDKDRGHTFGGDWTTRKLTVLSAYLADAARGTSSVKR